MFKKPGKICREFLHYLLLCVFDNTVSLSAEVVEHQVLSRNAEVVEHLLNGFGHRAGTAHVVFDIFGASWSFR